MADLTQAEVWSRYVQGVIGNLSNREVADRTGLSPTQIGNWVNGVNYSRPDLWRVIDFVEGLRLPDVTDAFIAAGVKEDLLSRHVKPDPVLLTNDEVLEEVARRFGEDNPRGPGEITMTVTRRPTFRSRPEAPDL